MTGTVVDDARTYLADDSFPSNSDAERPNFEPPGSSLKNWGVDRLSFSFPIYGHDHWVPMKDQPLWIKLWVAALVLVVLVIVGRVAEPTGTSTDPCENAWNNEYVYKGVPGYPTHDQFIAKCNKDDTDFVKKLPQQ